MKRRPLTALPIIHLLSSMQVVLVCKEQVQDDPPVERHLTRGTLDEMDRLLDKPECSLECPDCGVAVRWLDIPGRGVVLVDGHLNEHHCAEELIPMNELRNSFWERLVAPSRDLAFLEDPP